jgi:dTDP-4-amino-4,6-dideoxygalactose transaminase
MRDDRTWLSIYAPLSPGVYLRRAARRLPFPLDQPGCRIFAQARQGLWHALRAAGLREGDEVLAPAYHHGCEIETLVRAGLTCRFYDVGATIAPCERDLDDLLGPRSRALHLIHYLGFPQDASRWRRWCDERGLLLIEDGAQAWLSADDGSPVGAHGDIAIFCLYKTIGIPDGGAVLADPPVPAPTAAQCLGLRRLVRRHRDWVAQRLPALARMRPELEHAHEVEERPEKEFALTRMDEPALVATRVLLSHAVEDAAPARRRANSARLAAALGHLRSPVFPPLTSTASPLAFPIEVDRKPAVLARLAEQGIIDGKLWCVPHPTLDVAAYPGARKLRTRLIGLPVHQELRPRDVMRIIDAARRAVAFAGVGRPALAEPRSSEAEGPPRASTASSTNRSDASR